MKQKLIEAMREVPISGKTYEEYVEAVADKLIAEDYRKASEVAREIFEEIEKVRQLHTIGNIDGVTLNVRLYELKKKYTEEGK